MLIIILLAYFILINLIGFGVFGYDKYLAVKKKRRIPEKDLFLVTMLGGFVGTMYGMSYFRHKTIKTAFLRRYYLIIFAWLMIRIVVLLK